VWEISVAKPGHSPLAIDAQRTGGEPIAARLDAPHRVVLDVVFEDLTPLAEAIVLLTAPRSDTAAGRRPVIAVRASSSRDGRVIFESVAAGAFDVWVAWPDGLPVRVGEITVPSDDRRRVLVPGGARIQGHVTDERTGGPVAGVRLLALGSGGYVGVATTDADGAYAIDTLGAGPLRRLVTWKTGYSDLTHPDPAVPLSPGATIVRDFAIFAGGAVVGTVRGPDGPIEGATVQAWVADTEKFILHRSGETDADGNFRIDGVRPGKALVEVQKPGFVHPGLPGEMKRFQALLGGELDERCSAEVKENRDVRLDVTLQSRAR
jgi:hypothetical protein